MEASNLDFSAIERKDFGVFLSIPKINYIIIGRP